MENSLNYTDIKTISTDKETMLRDVLVLNNKEDREIQRIEISKMTRKEARKLYKQLLDGNCQILYTEKAVKLLNNNRYIPTKTEITGWIVFASLVVGLIIK